MIFCAWMFGGIEQKAAGDAAIVLDGLEQLLLLLLPHAGKFADFAFARQLVHALEIADVIGAPDQRDGLRSEALDLQQVEHRRVIFLQQVGVQAQASFFEHFLQVEQHAFADAGNGEHFLGFVE